MKRAREKTIYDIAREADVSISTVSRVLTGSASVKPDKKERIEKAIAKYDYHPNVMARNLIQSQTKVIGIITADIRNPYYSTMFVECEHAANECGYTLLLCNSFSERRREYEMLDQLVSQHVDAIIQIGGSVDDAVTDPEYADTINRIENHIPVITTGRLTGTDCYHVNINGIKAISLVMEYLVSLGYERIAFGGGCDKVLFTMELRAGYRQMLNRYGLEYRPDYIVGDERYNDEGGYAVMEKLLASDDWPQVVIAVNDYTAAGMMRALNEHGLRVPEDIGIVSFDDTLLSQVTIPKLTSVSYNYRECGSQIIQTAVRAVNGEDMPREIMVEPELVVRNSCREVR